MTMVTQRKGQIGVNAVEGIVLKDWQSRWQPIDSYNDDGIDGLIFIEAGGRPTGQIVFAQVKYRRNPRVDGDNCISIDLAGRGRRKSKIERRIRNWSRVVGAAILICVTDDGDNLTICWADIRATVAWSGSRIRVPIAQSFNGAALKDISELCGTISQDFLLEEVRTASTDFDYMRGTAHPQTLARQYYRHLSRSELRFRNSTAPIRFSREGWHHITRRKRSRLIQLQSFQLLGTLPAIVRSHSEGQLKVIETRTKEGETADYIVVEAAVRFPFRQAGIIAVIFRRRKTSDGTYSYSFRTIYEPRRRRDLIGSKK